MGIVDTGQTDPGHSQRVQNTLHRRTTLSTKNAKSGGNGPTTVSSGRPGDSGDADEGCSAQGQSCAQSVSQPTVLSGQKGWREKACDKSQSLELTHPISSFQDGGSPPSQGPTTGERLSLQNRPEGRVLLYSSECAIKEIPTVSMERKSIRISLPVFWTGTSTSHIYQASESSNSCAEENKYKGDYFSGRYVIHGAYQGGTSTSQGHNDIFITKSGFDHQPEKIRVDSCASDRIFRPTDKFIDHVDFTASRENLSDSSNGGPVHEGSQDLNFRLVKVNRKTVFCCASSSTRQTESAVLANAADSGVTQKSFLQYNDSLKSTVFARTSLVETESSSLQWSGTESDCTRFSDSNRRLQNRLGSSLSRDIHWRGLVFTGSHSSYKCAGDVSSKTSSVVIHQGEKCEVYSFSNRQYNSFELPSEDGGTSQPTSSEISQRNMGVFVFPPDHNYCRVATKSYELQGRLGVTSSPGHKRVEIKPTCIQSHNSTLRDTKHRFICITAVSSAPIVHVVETRSKKQSNGCTSTGVDSSLRLRLPSFQFNRASTSKSTEGTHQINHCDPSLADSTLVCSPVTNVCKEPNHASTKPITFTKPSGSSAPISTKRSASFDGMAGFRKNLATRGLLEDASMLISNSRRKGTLSRYESAWRKWTGWCHRRQIDPYRCDLTYIINFLAELFQQGMEYYTVNSYRSAISAYHEFIDGEPVGKHPLVCSALKGVFNLRPPQPKYVFIWDVEKVLNFMDSLPVNKELSPKILTLKVATLMSLTAASRCSEISVLNIKFMVRTEDSYIFTFDKLFKSWRQGKPPPSLEFAAYLPNKKLCIVEAVEDYLQLTKNFRNNVKHQFFLGIVKPHQEVVKCTVSGWVKTFLGMAGIDTKLFKAHSTRSASSSKAKVSGLALQDILDRGNWSSSSVWQKRYHKFIASKAKNYQNSLMGNALNRDGGPSGHLTS